MRRWLLIGGSLLALLLIAAAIMVHELAPSRWPGLALAWSPSVDHVMRAALTQMWHNPAGMDACMVAQMTERFAPATLLRNARRGGPWALRSAFFLAPRAVEHVGRPAEPAAFAALLELAASEDPFTRSCVLFGLSEVADEAPLVERLLGDREPMIQQQAVSWCRRIAGSNFRLSSVAIERLAALVVAQPRPSLVGDSRLSLPDLMVNCERIPMRLQTTTEADAFAASLRRDAWCALAAHAPMQAWSLAAERPLARDDLKAVATALGNAPDGTAWLTDIAQGDDDEVAAVAIRSLADLAVGTFGKTGGRPSPEAWHALVELGRVEVVLTNERRCSYTGLRRLLRTLQGNERATVIAALPDEDRCALAARMGADDADLARELGGGR